MRTFHRTSRWSFAVLMATAGTLMAPNAQAESAPSAGLSAALGAQPANLPDAAQVFENYIEAIGGREAISKIKNRRIKGTYEGDPLEFKAKLEIWWEGDGRYHQKVNEPAGLRYELYSVDDMTWSVVMDREPSPMGGVQRQELLDTADFWGEANYEERYKEIKVVREAKAGDTAIYIVNALTHAGRPHTLYFAQESGLLIGNRVPVSGPKNTIRDMTVRIMDYKDFGGVLYPTRFIQEFADESGGKPNQYDFTSIEVNVEDDHEYVVPDSVREQFAKSAQEPG